MSDAKKYFSLDGKIALVTGGLGILGPVWIRALLEAGASVCSMDLAGREVPPVIEKLSEEFPGKFKHYNADITLRDDLGKIHSVINSDFGNVGILVNNAGIDSPPGKRAKNTEIESGRMWMVNVHGAANCIEEFYPDMVKNKSGSIINIGSLYASVSPYGDLYSHLDYDKPWAYGSTKAALVQLTRHFATRLAEWNIRVNTLSPGGVLWNQDPIFIKKFEKRVPLGRMADTQTDLGPSLIYLASDAAKYVTGINLNVNGGYDAW